MPRVIGRRGAGLGNELNGWAKAYIASRVLGSRLLHPQWGLNPRHYRHYFGTSRLDWAHQLALRAALPTFELTEDDFQAAYRQDFRETVKRYADRHGLFERKAFVLRVGRMWGGKGILREAFPFIRGQLLNARGTAANLAELETAVPPHALKIALHVRRGDFIPQRPPEAPSGPAFNTAIPLDWYVSVCRSVLQQLSVPHRFMVFSDASLKELAPLLRLTDAITTAHQTNNVCSDLLAMASADLLVTSCSSFSTWAAALSASPYIWHADNLAEEDGVRTIWDHGAPLDDVPARIPRGVPVGSDGRVPPELVDILHHKVAHRGWGNDLVFYGRLTGNARALS